MLSKKSALLAIILFLLGAVSAIQAAPPPQEESQGRKSLRDTFDLNDNGTVNGHQNLGAIMSQSKTNDGDIDPSHIHPVVSRIADHFGVPYDQVQSLRNQGYGLGTIVKAHFFSKKFGLSVTDLLDGEVRGWGNVLKSHEAHPGTVNRHRPNKGAPPEYAGKPGSANAGQGSGDDDDGDINQVDETDDDAHAGAGKGKSKGKDKDVDYNDHDDNDDDDIDDDEDGTDNGGRGKGKGNGKGKNK